MAPRCGTARRSAVGSFKLMAARIRSLARQQTSWNKHCQSRAGWRHLRRRNPRRHFHTCVERVPKTRACSWASIETWPCRTTRMTRCRCWWCRARSSCGLSNPMHWSIQSTTCDTPCTGAFRNAWQSRHLANPWHTPTETGVFRVFALTWR